MVKIGPVLSTLPDFLLLNWSSQWRQFSMNYSGLPKSKIMHMLTKAPNLVWWLLRTSSSTLFAAPSQTLRFFKMASKMAAVFHSLLASPVGSLLWYTFFKGGGIFLAYLLWIMFLCNVLLLFWLISCIWIVNNFNYNNTIL